MIRVALLVSLLALILPQMSWAQHKHQKITSKMTLDARHKAQLKVIKHDRDVLRFFRNHHWLMMAKSPCAQKARSEVKFHQAQLRWMRKELKETRAAIKAREAQKLRLSTNWRAYLVRLVGYEVAAGCALPLIGRESGGVVTKWNYGGSGAYGLGQALPASKMAPFGSDYMTNGVTQIKWMHSYTSRYGGWCGANAFQAAHGWY